MYDYDWHEWDHLTAGEKALVMSYDKDCQRYMQSEGFRAENGLQIWNDSAAVSAVRKVCGVQSLRDLTEDNDKFLQFLSGYKEYHRENNTITRSGSSDV